jgi:transposase
MRNTEFASRMEAALTTEPVRGDWKRRLADATGVSYSTVKRWVAGEWEIPGYAIAILELLEVTPAAMRPERWQRSTRRR